MGHTKGEVALPLPVLDQASGGAGSAGTGGAGLSTKDKVHMLEGAIVTWTKQIKGVLRQEPEQMLKGGAHPTPDAEILFWRTKASHLNAIFDQL